MKKSNKLLILALVLSMIFAIIGSFGLTVSAASGNYTLVTDVSQLSAGDQVVIVAKDSNYALSTTQNSNNRGQASVTKSGNTVTFGSDVQVLELESGKESGTFAFNTGAGYLYAASSGSNHLKTETTLSNNSSWKITIAADGTATVVAQGSNTRNTMQYNASSKIFSCYASASQKAICIYKVEASTCAHSNTTTTTVPATCTEAGSVTVTCDDCGGTVSTEVIEALGHNFVNRVCTNEGCNEAQPASIAGRYYIAAIRTSGNYFYMTSDLGTASTKRYQAVDSDLTVLPTQITNSSAENVFVLVENDDATYSIYAEGVDGNNYLGWTTGNSGALVAESDAKKFTIERQEDGTYHIFFDTRYLSLNGTAGNNYFAFYTGSQRQDLSLIPVSGSSCEHTNTTTTTVNATCTASGSITVTCDDCGNVVESSTIGALGHNFVNGICDRDGCGEVEPSEVIFDFGANGSASHVDGSDLGTTVSYTSGDYTLNLTSMSKVYGPAYDAMGNSCIKLGTSSAVAKFSFTVGDDVEYVIINVAGYKANAGSVTVNGTSHSIDTISNDGEYTAIKIDTTTTKTIEFATISGSCRAMINSIAFGVKKAASPECTHTNKTTTTVDATCTEAGSVTVTCDDCGETVSTETIAALGHIDENYNHVCDRSGCEVTVSECVDENNDHACDLAACRKTLSECVDEDNDHYCDFSGCDNKVSNHNEDTVVPGKAATCTETGLTEGKKCSVCGEIMVAQEVIPAGHTEEVVPGKAATCIETGLTEGKKCSVCGVVTVAQNEISLADHHEVNGSCEWCDLLMTPWINFTSQSLKEQDGQILLSFTGTTNDKDLRLFVGPDSTNPIYFHNAEVADDGSFTITVDLARFKIVDAWHNVIFFHSNGVQSLVTYSQVGVNVDDVFTTTGSKVTVKTWGSDGILSLRFESNLVATNVKFENGKFVYSGRIPYADSVTAYLYASEDSSSEYSAVAELAEDGSFTVEFELDQLKATPGAWYFLKISIDGGNMVEIDNHNNFDLNETYTYGGRRYGWASWEGQADKIAICYSAALTDIAVKFEDGNLVFSGKIRDASLVAYLYEENKEKNSNYNVTAAPAADGSFTVKIGLSQLKGEAREWYFLMVSIDGGDKVKIKNDGYYDINETYVHGGRIYKWASWQGVSSEISILYDNPPTLTANEVKFEDGKVVFSGTTQRTATLTAYLYDTNQGIKDYNAVAELADDGSFTVEIGLEQLSAADGNWYYLMVSLNGGGLTKVAYESYDSAERYLYGNRIYKWRYSKGIAVNYVEHVCSDADNNHYCDTSACGKELSVCTPAEAVEENRIESTCTVAGSYDSVVKCSVCSKELSRDEVALPLADHTPADAVEENRIESTCTVAGSYESVVYCSVCNTYEFSRDEVDLPLASHTYENGECKDCGAKQQFIIVSDATIGNIGEEHKDIILQIQTSGALVNFAPTNVPDGAQLVIELVDMDVVDGVTAKIVFDVAPMSGEEKVQPTEAITFRLPVPSNVTKAFAKVYHESELMGIYAVKGEGNARYVEVSSKTFSEYSVEPVDAVAKIGTTKFASLEAAFAAAVSGDEIVLLSDIEIASALADAGKGYFNIADGVNITLDLNGKTIDVTDNSTGNFIVFYNYGEFTIKNGTVNLTATNNRAWNAQSTILLNRGGVANVVSGTYTHNGGTDMAFALDNSGNWYGDATMNITGGTITSTYTAIRNRMEQNSHGASGEAILNISGGEISGTTSAIWAQAASTSTTSPATGEINVSGGTVGNINTARSEGAVSMTTISGGTVAGFKGEVGELTVNGGTLTGDVTILTAAGEAADYAVNADGVYVSAVAKIGEVKYATLADAIAAAQAGDEIVIISDIVLDETVTVPAGAEIAIDLNGKSITAGADSVNLMINGTLTIKDSVGTGVSTFRNHWIQDGGKLVLESGKLQNIETLDAGFGVNIENGASFVMNGGTVEAANTANYAVIVRDGGYAEINDGTVTGKFGAINNQGEVAINGGIINVIGEIGGHCLYNVGKATVTAGDFNPYNVAGSSVTSYSVYAASGEVAISGGSFEAEAYGRTFGAAEGAVIKVSGGTFTSSEQYLESNLKAFFVSGYVIVDNGNGTYGVEYNPAFGKVAKIGDTYYETLADAIAAAEAGDVITLIADVTVTEKINLTGVSLDLNSHTLYLKTTGNYVVDTVTISNGTIDISGNSVNGNTFFTVGGQWAKAGSVLNLNDVDLIGDGYHTDWAVICVHNGTSLNMDGCTVDLKNDNGTAGGFIKDTSGNSNTADIVISNSTITLENVDRGFTGAKVTLDNVDLTITGGEHGINGSELLIKDSTVSISDGTGRGITLNKYDSSIVNSEVTLSNMGEGGIRFKTANALTVDADSTLAATSAHADVAGATINGYAVTGTEEKMSNVTVDGGTTTVVNPSYPVGIGTTFYETLAEALAEAKDGDVITLYWAEGDDPIAMNGAVFGKTVTITGTALVDWDKGFLFIGRGGTGDGTVIFENAKLTSASESNSYGIHVSGREKDTTNKYNGTLIINNSTIELDYLINKGNITLDNSTLTVKNGFSIGGRPAVETESGEDATATINLTNSSKLVVNNHNGMGLGYEAIGIMNVTDGSTFECTQSFLITAKGTLNVDGGSVIIAGTLTNLGVNITFKDATVKINKLNNGAALFVEGENTIQIEDISGSSFAIRAKDGAIFNDSYMPGTANETLRLLGSATFNGGFKCAYLQGAGASQGGIGGTVTIEDGTVIEVSYGVEFSNDYVLNGGSIELSGGNASGGIWGFVFQDGNFEINTDISVDGGESYAPIHFTDAVATINSSITQVNSHGEPLYIGDASEVTLGSNALIDTLSVHGAGKLILDVTGMTDGEYANVKCSASGFTGTLETVGNDILSAEIVGGKIVLVDISVAKIGDKPFASIQAAVDAAAAGDVIVLTKDVVLTEGVVIAKDDSITLDLAGKTISMNDASGKTAYAIRNNGTLTVKDSVGNGTILFETSTPSMSNSYASNAISNYGTITIESGTIKNNGVGGACYALDNYAGSTATINGGKFMAVKSTVRIFNWTDGDASKATLTVNGGEIISDLGYAITFNMGNTPTVELNINGGTVTTNDPNYNLAVYIISKGDAKNVAIKVTDGTFNGYFALNSVTSTTMADGNISIEGGKFDGVICYDEPAFGFVSGGSFVVKPEANVCAEGCAFAENADGSFGIVEAKVTLNGDGYASFEEALEAANDGDTIALLDDVSFDEVLVLDKAITISANGKAITAAIKVSANVVIDNAVINGVAGNVAVITITGDAKLTVQGGKIVAAKAMSARSGSALSTDNQYILLADGTNGASAYLATELDYGDKNIFIGDANTITVSVKEAYKADLAARGFVTSEADENLMVTISGSVPYYIGENGNWFFNGEDTGKKAIGTDGNNFTIGADGYWYLNGEPTEYKAVAKDADQYTIGEDGYWYLNNVKTEFKALGTDGKNYTIGDDGYWYLNDVKTEHKAVGTDGDKVEIGDDGYWYINNVKTEYKAVGEPGQTPQFKIEDGNLKASFDGVTWEDLGPVVAAKPLFKIEDGVLKLSYDNVNWEPLGTVAGEAGSEITIEKVGDYYYWHIDGVNTNVKAEGVDGTKVTLEKVDGVYYWHIDGVNSGVKAEGIDGAAGSKVTLQKVDGVYYWHIDGVNSGVKAEGIDGAAGSKITLKPIDGVYYWHIDDVNSGVKAEGVDGTKVTLQQVDGVFYWFLNGVNSGVKAEGQDGSAPTISEDGFWVIGGVKTTYSAVGKDGKNYTIGEDGYWYCDGVKTEYRAIGVDGKTPTFKIDAGNLYVSYDNGESWTNLGRVVGEDGKTPYIGENGNWWIGDTDTEVPAQGQDGKAPFIGENGNWWIGDKDTGISATGNSDSDMKEIIMLCIGMAILCVITILVAVITRKSRSRWWILS